MAKSRYIVDINRLYMGIDRPIGENYPLIILVNKGLQCRPYTVKKKCGLSERHGYSAVHKSKIVLIRMKLKRPPGIFSFLIRTQK
jgi:hypothetical protein